MTGPPSSSLFAQKGDELKDIKVEEAEEWSQEEADFNVQYLRDRGRNAEADKVEELRGTPTTSDDGGSAGVTEGSVDDTLDWVGKDADRARQALDEEQAKEKPRSTLVDELKGILGEE